MKYVLSLCCFKLTCHFIQTAIAAATLRSPNTARENQSKPGFNHSQLLYYLTYQKNNFWKRLRIAYNLMCIFKNSTGKWKMAEKMGIFLRFPGTSGIRAPCKVKT